MIIQYDTRPNADIDEKLRSLIHSIQLALGEIEAVQSGGTSTSAGIDVSSILASLRQLSDAVTSVSDALTGIDERVTELEETASPASYNSLTDRPSIEGVTLAGDKLFPDLNLNILSNTDIQDIFENLV